MVVTSSIVVPRYPAVVPLRSGTCAGARPDLSREGSLETRRLLPSGMCLECGNPAHPEVRACDAYWLSCSNIYLPATGCIFPAITRNRVGSLLTRSPREGGSVRAHGGEQQHRGATLPCGTSAIGHVHWGKTGPFPGRIARDPPSLAIGDALATAITCNWSQVLGCANPCCFFLFELLLTLVNAKVSFPPIAFKYLKVLFWQFFEESALLFQYQKLISKTVK